MEQITFDLDIPVISLDADFPNGVMAAHMRLHDTLADSEARQYYGLSWSDGKGGLLYKAAASERSPGEAAEYGFDTFVIKKGVYISETLKNFMDDIPLIGETFQKMLDDPRIDPQGYCLEYYLGEKDMRCMVLLDASKV